MGVDIIWEQEVPISNLGAPTIFPRPVNDQGLRSRYFFEILLILVSGPQ